MKTRTHARTKVKRLSNLKFTSAYPTPFALMHLFDESDTSVFLQSKLSNIRSNSKIAFLHLIGSLGLSYEVTGPGCTLLFTYACLKNLAFRHILPNLSLIKIHFRRIIKLPIYFSDAPAPPPQEKKSNKPPQTRICFAYQCTCKRYYCNGLKVSLELLIHLLLNRKEIRVTYF